MGEIIEASSLPEYTKVYLKKDIFGYRVVEPIRNPETGKINYFNLIFGGKRNLFLLIVLILIIACLLLGINELVSVYKAVAANPCVFCSDCHAQCSKVISDMNKITIVNFSNLNIT